jgi:hypothetical protein
MTKPKDSNAKPLWICPKCQRKFARAHQWHSCASFTIVQYLDGKPPEIVALFDRLVEMAKACGSVIVSPTKSMVLFKARTTFAEIKAKKDRLDIQLVFDKRVKNSRFTKVSTPWPGCIVHSLQVQESDELDDQVAGWLKLAYETNLKKHSVQQARKKAK